MEFVPDLVGIAIVGSILVVLFLLIVKSVLDKVRKGPSKNPTSDWSADSLASPGSDSLYSTTSSPSFDPTKSSPTNSPAVGAAPASPAATGEAVNPSSSAPTAHTLFQGMNLPTSNSPASPSLLSAMLGFGGPKKSSLASAARLEIDHEGDRIIYWYDGIPYGGIDDIPDASARERARLLVREESGPAAPATTVPGTNLPPAPTAGPQTSNLAAAPVTTPPAGNSPVASPGNGTVQLQINIIVNGVTYHTLGEITDAHLRMQAAEALLSAIQISAPGSNPSGSAQ